MKALRIFLQLIIVSAGGVVLLALITQPSLDITNIIVFLGFLAFLLALTLVLKENTEKRLAPNHRLSFKPISIVLLLLGAFAIFHGVSYLIGSESLPYGSGKCRMVCGLILLVLQMFGETVAKFFAFGLLVFIGVLLCFVGYKVWGVEES